MPGYDSWKTRSPDDDLEGQDPPTREDERADYIDGLQQTNVNECPSCKRMFVDGETCSRGSCPMGGDV
jgi:hypothetical protein